VTSDFTDMQPPEIVAPDRSGPNYLR
jgi:hypothetical protein